MTPLPSVLLREVAGSAGLGVRVRGDCMAPVVRDGDLLRVRRGRPFPGDVVLVRRSGGLVAHRLLGVYRRRGEWRAVTRGDRAAVPDAPAPLRDVVGVAEVPVAPRARLGALAGFVRWSVSRLRRRRAG